MDRLVVGAEHTVLVQGAAGGDWHHPRPDDFRPRRDLVPRRRRPVDRAGSALVVVDYKTGSPQRFKTDIHTKVRGRFCSTSKEAERKRKPARCRVLSGLLDKLGWHAAIGRRSGG